jgi:cell wall-associated NlpC family hydrolase
MIAPDTALDVFLYDVLSFLGTWYSWGGDDPTGFDCSGLVVEGLKAAGLIARGSDHTADQLWKMYPRTELPKPGCLVLFGKKTKATHVEVVVGVDATAGTVWTVGASGGGSRTRTKEDAIRDNAFVKMRTVTRADKLGFVDPFQGRR